MHIRLGGSLGLPRNPILLVAALAVLLLPGYLLTAGKLTDHDCFIMGEVAQRVLAGDRLYEGAWDNKPPLALFWAAAPLAIAPGSYTALQAAFFVLLAAEALLACVLLRDEPAWFRAAAGGLILLLPLQRPEYAWASSEDIHNFFVVPVVLGAYRALRRGRMHPAGWAAMGAALALACHVRQTAALFGLVPLAVALGLRSPPMTKLLRIAAMAVGGLAAWALLVAALSPIMSLPGYVQTVFLAPRQYRGHYWEAVTLLSAVRNDAAGMVIFAASALLVGAGPRPWSAAAIAPAPAGTASPAAGPTVPAGRWFFAAVVGAAGAAVFAPMRPFLHYWEQIAPALVLMVPAALAVLAPRPRRFATAVAGLFLSANAAFTVAYLGLVRTPLSDEHVLRERMDAVAGLIRRVSAPGDSLLAVGRQSAYLAFAAGLRPATTFFWDGFWDRLVPLSGRTVEAAGGELRAAPPAILALPADGEVPPATLAGNSLGPILREWLTDGRYEEVGSANGWRILRRR